MNLTKKTYHQPIENSNYLKIQIFREFENLRTDHFEFFSTILCVEVGPGERAVRVFFLVHQSFIMRSI